jgi:hypothetical protein
MPRRLIVLVAIALAAPTAVARGDIGIVGVAPTHARPGDRIRVTAQGYLGMTTWPYPVVMVEARRAPQPYSCMHGTAICEPSFLPTALSRPPFDLVGWIMHWQRIAPLGAQQGRATLTFRLPRVAPGLYAFGLFCASCTPGPKGSLIVAALPLRVYDVSERKGK